MTRTGARPPADMPEKGGSAPSHALAAALPHRVAPASEGGGPCLYVDVCACVCVCVCDIYVHIYVCNI